MQTNRTTKEEWIQKAIESVNHFDPAEANKLLRDWAIVHGSKVSDKQSDERLDLLRKNLLFTAFALLPADLADLVLKEYLIDFLKSGKELLAPIEKIESRIKVAGYGLYDQEREQMKRAVAMNNETIGKFAVSEWVKRFEKTASLDSDDLVNAFFVKDSEVAALSKDSQIILKLFLTLYEQWLLGAVLSVFDVAALYKKPGQMNSGRAFGRKVGSENRSQGLQGSSSTVVINLPLLQALSRYENLGNQLITTERIKIKSQSEPVRPSLLYWLRYYRDELGIGQHNSVERGQFLFRSENGKKLSPEERERVNLILKSIEENFPLSIDTERQEILFPAFQGVLVPSHIASPARNAASVAPTGWQNESDRQETVESMSQIGTSNFAQRARPAFTQSIPHIVTPKSFPETPHQFAKDTAFPSQSEQRREASIQNSPSVSHEIHIDPNTPFFVPQKEDTAARDKGSLSFTASHIFPAEKEAVEKRTASAEQEPPRQSRAPLVPASRPAQSSPFQQKIKSVPPQSNPFSIHPVSLRGEEEKE